MEREREGRPECRYGKRGKTFTEGDHAQITSDAGRRRRLFFSFPVSILLYPGSPPLSLMAVVRQEHTFLRGQLGGSSFRGPTLLRLLILYLP